MVYFSGLRYPLSNVVCLQLGQEAKVMYFQLMDRIAKSDDVDVAQLFPEDRQPLKSPTDKDKRRAERIEIEDTYINVRCVYSSSRLFCVVRFIAAFCGLLSVWLH